ncbi:MAG: sigma 54-interacting transcriptional regulator [Myxococcota bacterium]
MRTDGPVTEALATGAVTELELDRLRLFVPEGANKGMTLDVGSEVRTVGAAEGNHLRLVDRSVSRRHAEVWLVQGRLAVRDLGSTNGTFLGDVRVQQAELPPGAEVRFGTVTVKVVPLESARAMPHAQGSSEADVMAGMVGEDPRIREVFGLVRELARRDATVIIQGETGTGKELVARALHAEGPRRDAPFVVVDCAGQPRELIESNLFGHIKGAFTGATQDREGAFGQADGGTLFLDEVADLPLDLQPKLLRVLESREVQPVGSDLRRTVNVRVLAASHANLRAAVKEGRFREDLFYRLSVVRIQLPALRERLDDLPLLIQHFGRSHGVELSVAQADLQKLRAHAWPGNIRELKNLVDRACALGADQALSSFLDDDDSPATMFAAATEGDFKENKAEVVAAFERRYLQELMSRNRGNLSRAAREAGLDRKHLRELLRRYELAPKADDTG